MTTPLESRGFIRVDCDECKNPDVWFKCDQCGKSDHFLFEDGKASCDCGASYDKGNCTCGETVGADRLRFVAFDKGPMALAELEVAWGRVVVMIGAVLVVMGFIGWAVWQ